MQINVQTEVADESARRLCAKLGVEVTPQNVERWAALAIDAAVERGWMPERAPERRREEDRPPTRRTRSSTR